MVAGPKDKGREKTLYRATREELKLIDEPLAAVERDEIASNEEVEALFSKYRRA